MFTSDPTIVNARCGDAKSGLLHLRMSTAPTIRRLRAAAKLLLGLAIVAYLVYQAQSHQRFEEIVHNPKNWGMLVTSLACVVGAVLLGFVRWYLLVRAVDLPFTPGDAFRLGSLGFALNFVGPGGVGGDLFKGVALAREHKNRKSEAVATVVADRIIGLLSLLVITSSAILVTGMIWNAELPPSVRGLAMLVLALLAALLIVGGLFMAPGRISESTARLLNGVPGVGKVVGNLFVSCRVMSRRPKRLLPAIVLGIAMHLLLVFSFYTVSVGLPLTHPPLGEQFCIVPLAETAGAIPLTPGGLGTTEAALAGLYAAVGSDANSGAIVALGQRLVMLTAGIAAICYYLTQRKSIDAAINEAEEMV